MITSALQAEVQFWQIDHFVPYARNPRKNDAAVDRMCASIREFWIQDSRACPQQRRNHRWSSPFESCPETRPDRGAGDSLRRVDASAGEGVPTDGEPVRHLGRIRRRIACLELQDLREADFDLSLTGFEDMELARLLDAQDATDGLTDEDAVSELPEVPVSRTGDLWMLGDHTVLVGDSTDRTFVARLMGGDKADLIFTDPSYNVDYEGYTQDRLRIRLHVGHRV